MTSPPESPPVPGLIYDATENELRDVLRRLIARTSPFEATIAALDSRRLLDADLWQLLAIETGAAGLLVPESLGGGGASYRAAAVVLEECGRNALAVPFLESAVIATTALLQTPTLPAADAALADLIGGAIAVLAVPGTTAPVNEFRSPVRSDGEPDSGGDTVLLSGTVSRVLAGEAADLLIVPAYEPAGLPMLTLVDCRREPAGLRRVTAVSVDQTRPVAEVVLDRTPAVRLCGGGAAETVWQRALLAGAGMLASEQLGLAERALELAVDYLGTRHQFGRLIGSFQALRHRAADLWTDITGARAVARYAAACLSQDSPDTAVAVYVAQSYCADVAVHAAEECLQMLGGIGFSWEHPTHLLLKRAISSRSILGTPYQHRTALSPLVGLG